MLNLLVAERGDDRKHFMECLAACGEENISAEYAGSALSANDLFRKNPCRYDAVFLSVFPEMKNSAEAADTARQIQTISPRVQIVLMTAQEYLPFSVLEYGYFRLLKKPAEVSALKEILSDLKRHAAASAAGDQKLLVLRFNRKYFYLTCGSVLYIYKSRGGIVLVTEKGEYVHSGRIDEFEEQLGQTFCRCHGSFIVNFRHVIRSGTDYILMDDQQRISVSRAYRGRVKNFVRHMTENQKKTLKI